MNAWTRAREAAARDWAGAWRELAAATDGLTRAHPLVPPILGWLEEADAATAAGDWGAFTAARGRVLDAMARKDRIEVIDGPNLGLW